MRNVYFDDECDLFFDQCESEDIGPDGAPFELDAEDDYA